MKITREGFEKDYYASRPTEPYSDDDSPNDWANIAHYAEENLEKAYKRITEVEKENAVLKERNIKDCKNFNKAVEKIGEQLNQKQYQLTKAKKIIRNLLTLSIPIDYAKCPEPLQKIAEAEDFLKELEQ